MAAVILQADAASLDIREGRIVDASGPRMSLSALARTVYRRGDELPADLKPELIATRRCRVTGFPFVFTDGAMAAHVEEDRETGLAKGPGFWAVEDCGRVINPMLADEKGRDGVLQGVGGAPAAVMNAVNDALRPPGARLDVMPMTPERAPRALGAV